MKKFFSLSFAAIALLLISVSCSDDDDVTPPPPTVNPEVAKVINALKDIEGISGFTKVLSENALGLEVGDGNITVFAVKDASAEPKSTGGSTSTEEGGIAKADLKRHILSGKYDLSALEADSIFVISVSGDPVAISKKGDQIFINGILLENAQATKAGDNLIYVVEQVVPVVEIPKHTVKMTVSEINEEWADGKEEKVLSDSAVIDFFRYVDGEYIKVLSTSTDKGQVTLDHFYSDSLFYTVKKGSKSALRDDYQVIGLFTTQQQVDEAPEYKTGTALDKIAVGTLKVADNDGDGIIDEKDKVENGYLKYDIKAEKTELVIVSDTFGIEESEEE